jgi:formylglycine-generating enzyme required for sulfatase activity
MNITGFLLIFIIGKVSDLAYRFLKIGPMKNLFLPLVLISFLLVFSCSKDKDPEPDNSDLDTYHMVLVKGGSFLMGCTSEQGDDCFSREEPVHVVTLSDFYISKYEVTQQLWRDIMGENPSYFQNCDQCPVEQVSWEDIQEFLVKLNEKTGKNYRLPTEAEWEYAARGGAQSAYSRYSGSDEVGLVAWYDDNSDGKTHPIGGRKANELGLYDMSGNVVEWCQDWFGPYSPSPQSDPQGPGEGSNRVQRGGSWSVTPQLCSVSIRFIRVPALRNSNVGFRLARSL